VKIRSFPAGQPISPIMDNYSDKLTGEEEYGDSKESSNAWAIPFNRNNAYKIYLKPNESLKDVKKLKFKISELQDENSECYKNFRKALENEYSNGDFSISI
jgi:hypothetical protein